MIVNINTKNGYIIISIPKNAIIELDKNILTISNLSGSEVTKLENTLNGSKIPFKSGSQAISLKHSQAELALTI